MFVAMNLKLLCIWFFSHRPVAPVWEMTLDQAYSTWEIPSQWMTALLISNQQQRMVILIQEEIWQLVSLYHFYNYHKEIFVGWCTLPCEVLLIVHCFILQFLQTKSLGISRPLTIMVPVLPNQQGMNWRNCVNVELLIVFYCISEA